MSKPISTKKKKKKKMAELAVLDGRLGQTS
jgi:hypothetical protein